MIPTDFPQEVIRNVIAYGPMLLILGLSVLVFWILHNRTRIKLTDEKDKPEPRRGSTGVHVINSKGMKFINYKAYNVGTAAKVEGSEDVEFHNMEVDNTPEAPKK